MSEKGRIAGFPHGVPAPSTGTSSPLSQPPHSLAELEFRISLDNASHYFRVFFARNLQVQGRCASFQSKSFQSMAKNQFLALQRACRNFLKESWGANVLNVEGLLCSQF